jgi:hypothetical protein
VRSLACCSSIAIIIAHRGKYNSIVTRATSRCCITLPATDCSDSGGSNYTCIAPRCRHAGIRSCSALLLVYACDGQLCYVLHTRAELNTELHTHCNSTYRPAQYMLQCLPLVSVSCSAEQSAYDSNLTTTEELVRCVPTEVASSLPCTTCVSDRQAEQQAEEHT